MQFIDDILYTLTLRSYACTYRINGWVHGIYSNLRTGTSFPDNGLDFHSAAVNFRYFQFKQTLQQTRMGAGKDDFRSLGCLTYFQYVALNLLIRFKGFTGDLFIIRKNPFYTSKIHKYGSGFAGFYSSCDDIPFTTGKFRIDGSSFRFTQFLNHHLLSCLCSCATKILRCHINTDIVAFLVSRIQQFGILYSNLVDAFFIVRINFRYHYLIGVNMIFTCGVIHINRCLYRIAVFLLIGSKQHHFQCFKYYGFRNLFNLYQRMNRIH